MSMSKNHAIGKRIDELSELILDCLMNDPDVHTRVSFLTTDITGRGLTGTDEEDESWYSHSTEVWSLALAGAIRNLAYRSAKPKAN